MSESRTLSRILGEFLVIVVGVVAALGVDRWVQGIDDARAEETYLELVRADLQANEEIFQAMVQDWEAARGAAAALTRALEERARPSDSGLFMAVARAGTVNTIPARDASFRDMEATGNIRLISQDELRSQIVSYFTHDIRFGRPTIKDRLDLRFRTFARESTPPELDGHRELCPSSTPSFDCVLESPPAPTRCGRLWSRIPPSLES